MVVRSRPKENLAPCFRESCKIKSWKKILNNVGPRREPWITPVKISKVLEKSLPSLTTPLKLENKFFTFLQNLPLMPRFHMRSHTIGLRTLSKHFLMSKKAKKRGFLLCLYLQSKINSLKINKLSVVLLPFRNPFCSSCSLGFLFLLFSFSKKDVSRFSKILSYSLKIWDRRAIGRKFAGSYKSPCLSFKMGLRATFFSELKSASKIKAF